MQASIAVVIPCHDLGRTLEEAVDSVLTQTRAAAQIVVVDDGSTDLLTRQVLDRLDRPRTRVLRLPHGGVATARNTGVAHTQAPYVLFLDADDVLAPSCLEQFAGRLDAEPQLHFVSGAVQAFEGASYVWKPPSVTALGTLTRGSVHIASMFRRDLWNAVGGFDLELPGYEDMDFWLTALEKGFRGAVLDDVLLHYRVRHDSRYRQVLEPDVYRQAMRRIIERHRGILETNGTKVLEEKEAFVEEILRHQDHLLDTQRAIQRELTDLDGEIRQIRAALDAAGRPSSTAAPAVERTWQGSHLKHEIEAFVDRRRWLLRGRIALVAEAAWMLEGFAAERFDEPARGLDAQRVLFDRLDLAPDASLDCAIVVGLAPGPSLDRALAGVVRALKPTGTMLLAVPAVRATGPAANGHDIHPSDVQLRRTLARFFPIEAFDVDVRGQVVATACATKPEAPRLPPLRQASRPEHGEPPTGGLVLAYHRVGTLVPDTHRLAISADAFRRQMRFLRQHATVMPLLDLFLAARDGRLPPRAVAVTFDDGYLDALTTAAPILEAEGIPATFFVNTERLEVEHEGWHDDVERVLLGDFELPAGIDLTVGRTAVHLDTRTPASRQDGLMALHGVLLDADASTRDRAIQALHGHAGRALPARQERRVMLADEIRTLAGIPGMEIGSHSARHLFLPSHPSHVQRLELLDAKRDLEALLDRSITAFAYPFGGHDDSVAAEVRSTPHLIAVTVEAGLVTATTDPMRLPRVEVQSHDLATFSDLLRHAFGDRTLAAEDHVSARQQAIDTTWQENDRLSRSEYAAGKVTLAARPQFLIIDPTSRCNARCVMCPVSFRAPGDNGVDLTQVVIDKLAPVLPAASHINLFSSGEPTIARHLDQVIERVAETASSQTKIWLSTNGKRLPARIVEALMEPRFGLQFSVDGGTPEVFEPIRRGIRFDELCRSLALAQAIRGDRPYPEFSFSSTMSKRNIHDLANIFELAERYGVGQVIFYEEDPEAPEEEAFALDESDRATFEQQLPRIERTGIRYSNGLYFRGANGLRAAEPPPPADPPRLQCSAPWKVFHQRADGTVRTCCTLRTSMGDLRHQTFEEVWNGEAYVRLRQAFVTQQGIPGTCYRCTDPLRTWGS